ncbi:Major Facilitator Superfamily protein [Marinomonas aquimarina]|uniref:Major Facilitator Superfamily protein n=1 Tax=Marinomonas aquimarina TaxID=295068 RepID=A0A1A8TIL3_9GAMM|nr:MFS transporter [Marinomonas aquimarina]SBS32312.1 Major Facilitator Superfamily protein [Marinomonas aquimarina]
MLNITVWGLSLGQALLITGNILLVSVTALIGQSLAPSFALATLPVALQFLGLMGVTLPAALLMGWLGRKKGFLAGNLIGVSGAILAFYAVQDGLFPLFCLATFLLGMAIGIGQQYRFAATENAPADKAPQAISMIMGAGVIAAVLGPNMAIWFEDWAATKYLGAFAALIALYAFNTLLIAVLPLRPPTQQELTGQPQSYGALLKKPDLVGAMVAGSVGYGVMVLVMTATPLAMQACGFDFGSTANIIQWHVLGMFLPSFMTGKLIARHGSYRIIQLGCILLLGCVLLNQFGISYWHFFSALVLLGVGWNFTFIGATALLTKSYQPADKARVQGLNDLIVFSSAAAASLLSGYWHSIFGWEILNLLMIPAILVAMFTLMSSQKRAVIIANTPTSMG